MHVDHVHVIKAFVNQHHGWAVADQFEKSWESSDFDSQNLNALHFIQLCLTALLDSRVFTPSVQEELIEYLEDLRIWLETPKQTSYF